VNGKIPPNAQTIHDLERYVAHHHLTDNTTKLPHVIWDTFPLTENISVAEEAASLFNHIKYELDPACVTDKSQFWYRQPDGRCNWLKVGQSGIGSGISKPREGPNPREVSNAFFKVGVEAPF